MFKLICTTRETIGPLPIVRCPGCRTAMAPSHPKKSPRTSDLEEITYTCPSCGMTTTRTIKAAG